MAHQAGTIKAVQVLLAENVKAAARAILDGVVEDGAGGRGLNVLRPEHLHCLYREHLMRHAIEAGRPRPEGSVAQPRERGDAVGGGRHNCGRQQARIRQRTEVRVATREGRTASLLTFGASPRAANDTLTMKFTRVIVMLTVVWLLLAALVIAKVALYRRNRIPKPDHNLDRQIYKLNQVGGDGSGVDQVYR